MTIRTVGGYDFFEVSSAMQKAIRRADVSGWQAFLLLELWTVVTGIMYGSVCSPSPPRIAMES